MGLNTLTNRELALSLGAVLYLCEAADKSRGTTAFGADYAAALDRLADVLHAERIRRGIRTVPPGRRHPAMN